MIIACGDLGPSPETLFNAAPGELFVHTNVAGVVPPYGEEHRMDGTSAAIEYATRVLGVRHMVVLGHSHCTEAKALYDGGYDFEAGFLDAWAASVTHSRELARRVETKTILEQDIIRKTVANLRSFPWITHIEESGALTVHGIWIDQNNGDLQVLDSSGSRFAALR